MFPLIVDVHPTPNTPVALWSSLAYHYSQEKSYLFEERIETAEKLRQLGNERFKRGHMEDAAVAYERCESFGRRVAGHNTWLLSLPEVRRTSSGSFVVRTPHCWCSCAPAFLPVCLSKGVPG